MKMNLPRICQIARQARNRTQSMEDWPEVYFYNQVILVSSSSSDCDERELCEYKMSVNWA
jgi:hypothetical protein